MAKRQGRRGNQRGSGRQKPAVKAKKRARPARRAKSARRPQTTKKTHERAAKRKKSDSKARTRTAKAAAPRKTVRAAVSAKTAAAPAKTPRLDRARRTLEDTVQTPPSSLNMARRGTAARTGRAEMAEHLRDFQTMSPAIAAGDRDVNVEDSYFTGDESPGGDNTTPDQDVVDEIGKALGVEYQDDEELKSVDKVEGRDRARWELDPASSEDYKDRK